MRVNSTHPSLAQTQTKPTLQPRQSLYQPSYAQNQSHAATFGLNKKSLLLPFFTLLLGLTGLKAQSHDIERNGKVEEGGIMETTVDSTTTTHKIVGGNSILYADFTNTKTTPNVHYVGDPNANNTIVVQGHGDINVTAEEAQITFIEEEIDPRVFYPYGIRINLYPGSSDTLSIDKDISGKVHKCYGSNGMEITAKPAAPDLINFIGTPNHGNVDIFVEPADSNGMANDYTIIITKEDNRGRNTVTYNTPDAFSEPENRTITEGPYKGVEITKRERFLPKVDLIGPPSPNTRLHTSYIFEVNIPTGVHIEDPDNFAKFVVNESSGLSPKGLSDQAGLFNIGFPSGVKGTSANDNPGSVHSFINAKFPNQTRVTADSAINLTLSNSPVNQSNIILPPTDGETRTVTIHPDAQAGQTGNTFVFTKNANGTGVNQVDFYNLEGIDQQETKIVGFGTYRGQTVTRYTQNVPNNGQEHFFVFQNPANYDPTGVEELMKYWDSMTDANGFLNIGTGAVVQPPQGISIDGQPPLSYNSYIDSTGATITEVQLNSGSQFTIKDFSELPKGTKDAPNRFVFRAPSTGTAHVQLPLPVEPGTWNDIVIVQENGEGNINFLPLGSDHNGSLFNNRRHFTQTTHFDANTHYTGYTAKQRQVPNDTEGYLGVLTTNSDNYDGYLARIKAQQK